VQVSRGKSQTVKIEECDYRQLRLHPAAKALASAYGDSHKLFVDGWVQSASAYIVSSAEFDAVLGADGTYLVFGPLNVWCLIKHLNSESLQGLRIRIWKDQTEDDVSRKINAQVLQQLISIPREATLGAHIMSMFRVLPLGLAQSVTGLQRISIAAIGQVLGRTWHKMTDLPIKQLLPVRRRLTCRNEVLKLKLKLQAARTDPKETGFEHR
jgi:hypothetical protein